MFLTQSIRRKMVFGLGLVLLMLAVLLGSGLWGLASFRSLVHDPSLEGASSSDVIASVVVLSADVQASRLPTDRSTFPSEILTERLPDVRQTFDGYRRRIEAEEASADPGLLETRSVFNEIERRMDVIERRVDSASATNEWLQAELIELGRLSRLLRDPPGFRSRVSAAHDDYRAAWVSLLVSSVVVLILLLSLVRFGWRHLFEPVSELHQGARRVAQGDFGYRVDIRSNDEMGELAESFNLMTERFQEIASDLDRQVRERSRQLVRSERLAGVGFLAAGVAHEINNPLTAIRWTGESLEPRLADLLRDVPDDEAAVVQQYLTIIQSESERCQEITRKLLDFSRNQDSSKAPHDVAAVIREVLMLVTHMKKYRECRTEFDRDEPCVIDINANEIKQVFLNLIANALEATGTSGTVCIRMTELVDAVEVQVIDDGGGMSPQTIDRLFDPFFTTRETGQGTGLGLSITNRIVTDHGGRIEAHSDGLGCGSTFLVTLPRKQPAERATSRPETSPSLVEATPGQL